MPPNGFLKGTFNEEGTSFDSPDNAQCLSAMGKTSIIRLLGLSFCKQFFPPAISRGSIDHRSDQLRPVSVSATRSVGETQVLLGKLSSKESAKFLHFENASDRLPERGSLDLG